MEEFWILILMAFFATNSRHKAESMQLFDEIFGEGWWDNAKAEEWDKLTLEHNFHHEIDRQNTQIGQIEPNSTDQNPSHLTEADHSAQIEPNSIDQLGQIEPNSTDQNPPLTKSVHSDKGKNTEEQNEMTSNKNIAEDERKRTVVGKFLAIKDEFKQKRKYSKKEWTQIDKKIAKHLKANRTKIYKWKKEFGLTHKFYEKEECKHFVEKFDQMKAEIMRAGLKNSYHHEIDETVAKELGLCFRTISRWKRKLGQTKPNKHTQSEQKELIKGYYEIKDKNPKIKDEEIAKMLKIGSATLIRWKRQFKRQQLHANSDGHSVEENAGSNV